MYPVIFEDCEKLGGHCFVGTNRVFPTDPPQYPEVCKHCGATRIGRPHREPMDYGDITPPFEVPLPSSPSR